MFNRTLPRLVAVAVGVWVILKLVFPEPPCEKEKEEKGDADTGGTDKEPQPAAAPTEEEAGAAKATQTREEPSTPAEERATAKPAEESAPQKPKPDKPQAEEPTEPAEPVSQPVAPEAPPEAPPRDVAQAPPPPPPPPRPPKPPPPPPPEHRAAASDETKRSERPVESELIPPEITGQDKDLVLAAAASGSFSAFGMALEQTKLDATLRGPGPFTVFAPTDKAFAELEGLDELMDDVDRLAWVLKNHIVSGHYIAADLPAVASLDAISGGTLSIDTSDDIKVEDASVVEPDIMAKNGVIHAINKVIIRRRFTR